MIRNICKLVMAMAIVAALFVTMSLFVFYGGETGEPLIVSVQESDTLVTIPFDEMSKRRQIEVKCHSSTDSSKSITIKGFSLFDLLSEKHIILSDFNPLVLVALDIDGHQTVIPEEMLEKQEAYIAMELNGQPLERPMLCFEEGPQYKDVKDLIKLDIISGKAAEELAAAFLRIDLDENPTTGYVWQYTVDGDENVLKEVLAIYSPEDTDGKVSGAGGIKRFIFEPENAGTVNLTFTLARSWQKSSNDMVLRYRYSVDENKKITRIR